MAKPHTLLREISPVEILVVLALIGLLGSMTALPLWRYLSGPPGPRHASLSQPVQDARRTASAEDPGLLRVQKRYSLNRIAP